MDSPITLTIPGIDQGFLPGERISAKATWSLSVIPRTIEVNLLWATSGRGTQDIKVVAADSVQNPLQRGEHSVALTLPDMPYTFSGKLIALCWSIEVVIDGGSYVERKELIISPTRKVIELSKSESW